MRFALQSALKDLRRLRRDPLALVLWLAIPLVVGLLLDLAFGGDEPAPRARLLVADLDDSFPSGLLVGAFGQGRLGEVVEVLKLDPGEARRRIDRGEASALLIVPAGFGAAVLDQRPVELALITNPAQRILPGIVQESLEIMVEATFYLQHLLREPISPVLGEPRAGAGTFSDSTISEVSVAINGLVGRVRPYLFPPAIQLVRETPELETAPRRSFAELFFPGMVLLALLFIARGLSGDVWRERSGGTLRRVAASPGPLGGLLAGKLMAGAAVIGAAGLVALAAGHLAFGVEMHNLPLAFLWITFTGTAMLALFVLLQLYSASERGGDLLTTGALFPLAMAGGSFFPFEVMPESIAAVGRLTPNGWALVELSSILGDQTEPTRLAAAFAAVLACGALAFAVAARRLRRFAAR